MMQPKFKNAITILVIWLAVYMLLRISFYFFYFRSSPLPFSEMVHLFYRGFRFDFTALFIINLPFLIFYFFISSFLNFKIQRVISFSLLILNIPFLAINFIDLAYFRFNFRRSNYDFIHVFWDSTTAFLSFLAEWWYLFALFLFISVLLFIYHWKILSIRASQFNWKHYLQFAVFILIGLIIARGTKSRPVIPANALLDFQPKYLPLVTNSSITFLYSAWKRHASLEPVVFYDDVQLDRLFNIRKEYADSTALSKKNVVIIILESFAKEYLEPGHQFKAQTPFLDSIRKESIDCVNAYANGLESNQGIVAILASIPPFTDIPYFHSSYAGNDLRGIGTILKEEGYQTSFFLGAGEDHFGFGKLCRIIGIDRYISGKTYRHQSHHDQQWGISDHYFLPFAAQTIRSQQTPFFSVVYNLSSHPPYTIPAEKRKQFQIYGQSDAQNSISYVDYSLSLFFKEMVSQPWYRNTIFVFTSDHSVAGLLDQAPNNLNAFTIPLFLHLPGNAIYRKIEKPVQQLDIVPTIIDLLDYRKPFMSFGNSILRDSPHFVYNKINHVYQIIDTAFIAGYSEHPGLLSYLYNYQKDSLLQKNLADSGVKTDVLEAHLKAFRQRYSQAVTENKLLVR